MCCFAHIFNFSVVKGLSLKRFGVTAPWSRSSALCSLDRHPAFQMKSRRNKFVSTHKGLRVCTSPIAIYQLKMPGDSFLTEYVLTFLISDKLS